MKILICGGRDFSDYEFLKGVLDSNIKAVRETCLDDSLVEIVSGGAKGADTLAEKYADEHKYSLSIFPAYWDIHGKKAGILRNEEMARYLHRSAAKGEQCRVIAFWDGKSRGTSNMIALSDDFDLVFRIYYYNQ